MMKRLSIVNVKISVGKNVVALLIANFIVSSTVGTAMILVPWVLVKSMGGDTLILLAAVAILITATLASCIGRAVDAWERKSIMVFLAVSLSVSYIALSVVSTESVIFIYMLGALYAFKQIFYNLFFSTRLALAQSLTTSDNYGKLNGWLEIENQSAAFSAGALALVLLEVYPVERIFFINGLLLLPAAGLFWILPTDKRTTVKTVSKGDQDDSSAALTKSGPSPLQYRRSLYLCFIAGNIPFVCVMLLDIIRPIVIAEVLNEAPEVLAISAMLYTFGAVVGGFYGTRICSHEKLRLHLALSVFGFTVVTAVIAFHLSVLVLYIASIGWGCANSIARISSQTTIMHSVDNAHMGRFIAHAQRVILLLRFLSVVCFVLFFRETSYAESFLFMAVFASAGPLLLAWSLRDKSLFPTARLD